MSITSISDHKLADGTLNWESYRLAQKANGEICSKCGGYTSIFGGKGHPDQCPSCKSMDEPSEATHHSTIRCPACGHQMDVRDMERGELYEDGEHDVTCNECEHEFEVSTSVSFSFESPARVAPKADADMG
jgi:hypothetical protein